MKKSIDMLHTPILFLVFNRPKVTRMVFEIIRQVKPKYLYIAADGPREGKENEALVCQEVLSIATNVDWDCEVKTLIRKKNLGCKVAVSEAISWFFQEEEQGIILEDDCLPTQGFFYYCQELLNRYKADNRIAHINGNNFNALNFMPEKYSYHFTYIPQVWGWATWRRAWRRYDISMKLLREYNQHQYFKHCGLKKADFQKISRRWMKTYEGKIDTWDYQWHFINMLEGNLVISPLKNQISNLGFHGEATHSPKANLLKSKLPTQEFTFPLQHPPCIFVDEKLNKYYKHMMINETLSMKIKRKLLKSGINVFK